MPLNLPLVDVKAFLGEAIRLATGRFSNIQVNDPPLPDPLYQSPTATARQSGDAGDFYCEHLFYVSQVLAPRAAVQSNGHGEKLVGFLHVPADAYTSQEGQSYTPSARHAASREVVGLCLRGYMDNLMPRVTGPLRILLTGYLRFMTVLDNPTGDFVRSRENLDAALQAGFGGDLLTPTGEALAAGDAQRFRWYLREGRNRRELQIHLRRFEVADQTFDPRHANSIQSAYRVANPHAVLAMGVHSGSHYRVEYHADDGALRQDGDAYFHEDGRAVSANLPDNRALARALVSGQRARSG